MFEHRSSHATIGRPQTHASGCTSEHACVPTTSARERARNRLAVWKLKVYKTAERAQNRDAEKPSRGGSEWVYKRPSYKKLLFYLVFLGAS
jgi:hypothetical protein